MCHPWLAAGVTCWIAAHAVREVASLRRSPPAPGDEARVQGMLGTRVRRWFRGRIVPTADGLLAAGVTANQVTLAQLVGSLLCGLAYARGWIFTAGWLLCACGLLDVLDGTMARRRGAPGARGALIDSTADRYGEAAVCAGLVAYYRNDWMLWMVLAAFVGGFMVSYVRARAESLGLQCEVGLMQRPERFVILGGGSVAAGLLQHLACGTPLASGVLAASVVVVAVLANLTALERMRFAFRNLT